MLLGFLQFVGTGEKALPITSFTWTAAAGGDWSTAADWSPGSVPAGTLDAALIGVAGIYTVTLASGDAPVTIDMVTINQADATLSLAGTMTLAGANASLDLAAGTLLFNGGQLAGGTLNQAGGTVAFANSSGNELNGVAVIGGLALGSGGLVLTGGSRVYADATETTLGTISIGDGVLALRGTAPGTLDQAALMAGGVLTFDNPGTTADATLGSAANVSGYGDITDGVFGYSSSDSLDNKGTINAIVSGQQINVTPLLFTNDATLMASSGGNLSIEQNIDRAWTNSATGTIAISGGGNAELSGPFSNAGLITSTGSTLDLDGTFNFGNSEATWINTGTIAATTSTINIAGDETIGQIGVLNHDTTDTQNYDVGTLDNSTTTLDGSSTALIGLRLNGATILGGVLNQAALDMTFANNSGNELNGVAVIGGLALDSGGLVLTGGSAVYADATETTLGTIDIGDGVLALRGTTPGTLDQPVLMAGGVLTFDNPGTTADATLGSAANVSGYGDITDSVFAYSSSDSLDSKGTIDANVARQPFNITPLLFTNDGTLLASSGGNLSIEQNIDRAWTNSATGTIAISGGGNAELSGPFSNAGLITSTGSTLDLDGTFNFGTPTTWINTGTISATTSTININGDETVAQIGVLNHDTTDTLNYDSGTLNNTGRTLDGGSTALIGLRLNGATILGGVLNQAALEMTFGNAARSTLDGMTVLNGLNVNGGSVQITNSTAVQGALTITNANVVLANGAADYADATDTTLGTITATNGGVVFQEAAPIKLAQTVELTQSTLSFDNPGTTSQATIGVAGVVLGSGNINDNDFSYSGPVTLDNAGSINSNISGQELNLTPTGFTNSAVLEASGGGNLSVEQNLDRVWTNSATGTIAITGGGNAELSGPFTSAGLITSAGSTLDLDGTFNFGTPTTWINTGTISATGSTVNINGDETVAQIGVLNHDTTDTLNYDIGTLDNTGATLDGGSTALIGLRLNGATILGGVLNQAALEMTFGNAARSTLDGMTVLNGLNVNGGSVQITDNSAIQGALTIANGNVVLADGATDYANATDTTLGTITATNGGVVFQVAAPITLAQTVELAQSTLSFNNPGTTAQATIGAAGVVLGSGNINDNDFSYSGPVTLDNAGSIDANISGQQLNITTTGFTNNAVHDASGGGSVSIEQNQNRAWTNTSTGTIAISGGGSAELAGPFSNAGLITSTGSTLDLDGTFGFGTPTTWINTGTISATGSTVNINGDETVAQIGTLIHDATDSLFYTGGTLENAGGTLNADSGTLLGLQLEGGTIEGGAVDQAGLGLTFSGSFANDLDNVALINGFTVAGGDVILSGTSTVYSDAAGTVPGALQIDGTGQVGYRGAGPFTLNGSVLLGGGILTWIGTGGTADVTLNADASVLGYGDVIDNRVGVSAPDAIANNGSIVDDVSGHTLVIDTTGLVNDGVMAASNEGSLQIERQTGIAWTNEAGGVISGGVGANVWLGGPFSNAGDINVQGGTLELDGTGPSNALTTWTNSGVIVALDETILINGDETAAQIGSIDGIASQIVYQFGTLDNLGGTLNAASTSLANMELDGATVVGGTIDAHALGLLFGNSWSTLDNVTLINGFANIGGNVLLGGSSAVYADASATTPGEIAVVNGDLAFGGATSYTLDSPVLLVNGALGWIGSSGVAVVTIATGDVVGGAGFIADRLDGGSNSLDAVTNDGIVIATSSIQSLAIDVSSFTNQGALWAIGGGVLQVQPSTFTNLSGGTLSGGTYEADAGSVIYLPGAVNTSAADIIINGSGSIVSGGSNLAATLGSIAAGGSLAIGNGGSLNLSSALTVDGVVALAAGTLEAAGISVAAGATIGGNGALVASSGSIDDAGTISAGGGTLSLDGPVGGSGTLLIGSGAALALNGVASNDVLFAGGDGTLDLANGGTAYSGTIEGFAAGDAIVLGGFDATGATYAGGVLTVNGAAGSVDLAVAGSFAAGAFQATVDAAGDTLITLRATPVLSVTAPSAVLATAGGTAAIGGISFVDSSGGTLGVQLSAQSGLLAATATNGASVIGDGSQAVFVSGGLAAVQATLATLTDTEQGDGTAIDSITVAARDAAGNTAGVVIAVTIDQPPTIEGAGGFEVAAGTTAPIGSISIADAELATAGGTLSVTLSAGGVLDATAATGATVSGDGSQTLVLSGSVGAVNTELSSLGVALAAGATADTLTITASDGTGGTATRAIALTEVTPPLVFLPQALAGTPGGLTPLDGIFVLDGAYQNETAPMTATLTDSNGTLAVADLAGTISGSGSSTVVISGDAHDINTDLATLTYANVSGTGPTLDLLAVTATSYGVSTTKTIEIANATSDLAPFVVLDAAQGGAESRPMSAPSMSAATVVPAKTATTLVGAYVMPARRMALTCRTRNRSRSASTIPTTPRSSSASRRRRICPAAVLPIAAARRLRSRRGQPATC